MKIKKVKRKLAVVNGDEVDTKLVEAYVASSGVGLFIHLNPEVDRWTISHRQSGGAIASGFVNRKHAFSFVRACYRREKDWKFGEFGVRIDSLNGDSSKYRECLREVEGVYQYGNVEVVLGNGKKTVVGLGQKYCKWCGGTKQKCFGEYIKTEGKIEIVDEPKEVLCFECNKKGFSVF